MRAVVLVGGKGTRLRPLTYSKPKQMLPVASRPMIEWVLGHLASHGIVDVVLSLGYQPDAFRDAYPDGRACGVSLRYAVEDEPLDTAGAIAFAARHAGIDETFLVVNGDVLTSLDITALVAFHRERDAEGTIALTPVEDPSRFGVVPTFTDGKVSEFIEKPAPGTEPTNFINAGTYVLEPRVLDRIPPGGPLSIERKVFPAMVAAGRLYALGSDADWVDAGTPSTYLSANIERAGLAPRHASTTVAPSAEISGSVLGPDVEVGAGAVVRNSVVLDGAAVGVGARIEDSVVGWHAKVGDGAQVTGGSLLGEGAAVATGESVSGARVPLPAP